ncbi:MAG: Flp pilus assembly complex ATPase component TadA [Burkholderiaceae bacterium]|nr:Flp pilus assembly complex ATPase component TadA [Burkholderiaceae bacterium]
MTEAAKADRASASKRKPLGQTLIERGVLSEDQLRIALMEQKSTGQPLGKVLVSIGFLTEATLREVLAENLGHEQVDLSRLLPNPTAMKLVPSEFAKRHHVFPVGIEERDGVEVLTLATPNPNDVVVLDQLQAMIGAEYRINACMAADGEVSAAIESHYGQELSIDGILNEIETGEVDAASMDTNGREYAGPFVRLVDAILADAVQRRASDIHFEPEQGFVRIRYRIDGVLRQIRVLHSKYWSPMLVRLKIIASMNIAETRLPQDGRISLVINGRPIDYRAASQPTLHGENVVLRILDRSRALVPLEKLGLTEDQLEAVETMISRPEGMILVTGPTGSGKTTTLYSILTRLNREGVNIMTLEDPVEYPIPMMRQSNIAAGQKMEFSAGIKSLMRQDPDIILVGEVRDGDTATMALRAAMTGHQVYSTLHTNSAIGALPRLMDLGLTAELIAGNLIGVVGQRLVRKLCPHCKVGYEIDAEIALMLGGDAHPGTTLYRAGGCSRCDYQGFSGRQGLLEILRFDEELDDLMARGASARDILKAARAKGFRTLRDDAIRRVLEGMTSLDEAGRVVDLTGLGH